MTALDILGGVFIGGAALAMTVVTVGPFYLMYKVLPEQSKAVRKKHFIDLRRTKRKERMRLKRQAALQHTQH